jgi:hypothetical protein
MATVHDTRAAIDAPVIPAPRTADEDTAPPPAPRPVLPVGQFPWPEPWQFSRAARPRSEFWDVTTAGWHSRGPYPKPQPD